MTKSNPLTALTKDRNPLNKALNKSIGTPLKTDLKRRIGAFENSLKHKDRNPLRIKKAPKKDRNL